MLSILFSEKKFVSDVQIISFSVERRVVVLISDESFLSEEDPGILSEGVILKAGCFGVKSRFTVSNEFFFITSCSVFLLKIKMPDEQRQIC